MEEKMNLSDFTKDGSPVVEQKQEEDAWILPKLDFGINFVNFFK